MTDTDFEPELGGDRQAPGPLSRPKLDDLTMVKNIINDAVAAGHSRSMFDELLEEVEHVNEYIADLDSVIGAYAPQDWGAANAMVDRLTGDRQFVATLASYYLAGYETSKKKFWPEKSYGTERDRERFQDSGSAVFAYLKNVYEERLKSLDKMLVRMNKILDRENILTNRDQAY